MVALGTAVISPDGLAQSIEKTGSANGQLDKLPASVSHDIKTICLPVQYKSGATAYRECVSSEVTRYEQKNAVETVTPQTITKQADTASLIPESKPEPKSLKPAAPLSFDSLAHDDKYAIQRTCQRYVGSDGGGYTSCLEEEMTALSKIPSPELSNVSSDEQFAIRQSCFSAQTNDGAAAYRQCLNAELAELARIPAVSTAGLTSVEKTNLQLECSPASNNQSAANYRICLAQSLERLLKAKREIAKNLSAEDRVVAITPVEINPEQLGTPSTTPPAAIIEQSAAVKPVLQNNTSTEQALVGTQPRIIPKPVGLDLGDGADTNDTSPNSVSTVAEPAETRRVTVSTLQDSDTLAQQDSTAGSSSSNDDTTSTGFDLKTFFGNNQYAEYARYLALLLPALFIYALWRLLSLMFRPSNKLQAHTESNSTSGNSLFDDVTDTNADSTSRKDPSVLSDRIRPDLSRASANIVDPDISLHDAEPDILVDEPASENVAVKASSTSDDSFAKWMNEQSSDDQKKYCIEFLLYWVSYGEGKYDPELKEAILESSELNDHDLIKKHIFLKDKQALVDTLRTTRKLFSAAELDQIINMMFAVLVEHAVSPTQNIFFRFFADFAGIGADGLSRKYEKTFGAPLPPIPRPDDVRWWAKRRELEDMKPRMARSEREIMLTRMGLNEPVKREELDLAWTRIADRFDPERFDLLGDKERKLIERHLAGYSHARESLMEEAS